MTKKQRNAMAAAMTVMLIGACLRAPFTCMGPLLEAIRADLRMTTAAIGMVGTIPMLAFALVSPAAPYFSRKAGLGRALMLTLLLVVAGVLLRSQGTVEALYAGTVLIGCGIAGGNVLLPSLVKRDFPLYIPRMIGLYALTMGVSAALGSALMVPVAEGMHAGWRVAAGSIVVFPAAACIAWAFSMRTEAKAAEPEARQARKTSLYRSALAWHVTLFFGLTSLTYYISVSWMPALLRDVGFSDAQAGSVHGLMQLASALPGPVLLPLIHTMKDQRLIAAAVALVAAAGMLGLAVLPGFAVIWGVCVGFGAGAAITLGLMFIGLRTYTVEQAASLSGMAQSIGYLLAAGGPIWAGALHDAAGGWAPVFYICAVCCAALAVFGWKAGRNVRIE